MLSNFVKTSIVPLAAPGHGKMLFLLFALFGLGLGFGQTVSITANDASASEAGLDPGQFTVSASGLSIGQSITVNLEFGLATTAQNSVDYDAISLSVSLSFLGNQETISINPIDDLDSEGTETVVLNILQSSAYSINSNNASATVLILDDEPCNAGNSAPVLDASEPTVFCDTVAIDLNDYVTSTAAPAGTSLVWSVDSNPLETAAHLVSSSVVEPGIYYGFFYDDVNGCASPILPVTIVRNFTPVIESTTPDSNCGSAVLTLSAVATVEDDSNITYAWFDAVTGGNQVGSGDTYVTPNLDETTSYYVSATANGCASERVEVVATINNTPLAGAPIDGITVCNVSSNDGPNTLDLDDTLIGQDPGDWTVLTDPSNGTLAIGTDNIVDFTGLPSGDYVFEYTTNGAQAPCENTSTQVTITVEDCVSNEAVDLALTKVLSQDRPYLVGEEITFMITLQNVDQKTVADILVTDLLDITFEYVNHTVSLGTYDPNTGEWSIPEMGASVAEATLEIVVTALVDGQLQNTVTLASSFPLDRDESNNVATVTVQLERSQCRYPGTICNIFSPNGDGINERLVLVRHDLFPNNTFEVFDRYGNSVFQMDGYDSSWDGTGENGDLPKGTYFYVLDLTGNGTDIQKGWIQIIR
ncbi:MAG: gliding motility-associated C-terminal domain-containing protein [Muricauda sp.]|nr:gliding motility-associated C-terminal domain-containing protein [Allomuricauda sp.]